MSDGFSTPEICDVDICLCGKCFVGLQILMNHPHLIEEEKYLYLWLATQCTNSHQSICFFSYEQLSIAVSKPCQRVHRILTRLRIMGFLTSPLPIWYGALTEEMIKEVRTLQLVLPPKPYYKQEDCQTTISMQEAKEMSERKDPILINLLKNR